jgi:general secretion pathway protein N
MPRQTVAHAKPRRTLAFGVVGALLGLLAALVTFAPARWVAYAVAQGSGGAVILADAQGRVWSGSAQLVLMANGQRQSAVRLSGRMRWDLGLGWGGGGAHASSAPSTQLQTSLLPHLQLQIHAPCCMAQALDVRVAPGWPHMHALVQNHQSQWPADLLAGLGTPWNTLAMQGQLGLSLQGLSLDWSEGRMRWAGAVALRAEDLASRVSTLKPLGSYRLTLQGGDVNLLSLESLPGSSLQLAGQGQWVGGRLRFHGQASAAASHEEALSNLLNIIGRRDGSRSIIQLG